MDPGESLGSEEDTRPPTSEFGRATQRSLPNHFGRSGAEPDAEVPSRSDPVGHIRTSFSAEATTLGMVVVVGKHQRSPRKIAPVAENSGKWRKIAGNSNRWCLFIQI